MVYAGINEDPIISACDFCGLARDGDSDLAAQDAVVQLVTACPYGRT